MKADLFDLSGKIAVVTGAARGLGQAAAVGLAGYGADVAAIDLKADSCGEMRREIEAAGRTCRAYGCDVADEHAVERTVEQIAADFGRIDILVNIAGITARIPTAEIPPEQVRRLTDVNYHGLHSSCLYPVDILLENRCYDVLEVNIDHPGGSSPALPDLLPVLVRIQAARRPLLLWGELTPDEWSRLRKELSPVGLSLQPIVRRADDMPALLEVLR